MALRELMSWNRGRTSPRSTSGERHPFELFHHELGRLFDDFMRQTPLSQDDGFWRGTAPRLDEVEDEDAINITAELPGMGVEDVELILTDGALTIRGEKKEEHDEGEEGGRAFRRRERMYGAFSRTIPLPAGIDAGKVEASFTNGVLHIDMPKTEEAKRQTRRIEVKSVT